MAARMDEPQAKAETMPATATPATGADDNQQPSLDNASLADLDAVQTTAAEKAMAAKAEGAGGGEQSQETTTTVEQPTSEKPASETETPTTETPAATEPEKKEPPTQAQAEPEPEAPERFRFKDSTDRAVAAIKKARPDLSWAEAEKLVVGDKPAADQVPDVDPIAAATTQIDGLKQEIADLEAQINPADEDEILSTKAQREATVKLAAKHGELARAEIKLEDAQRERQAQITQSRNARMTAREESKQRAISEFPDAADANTPLGKAIAAQFEALRNPNHPDHDILYADSAPEIVTEREAKKLGIAPKPKAPAAKPADAKTPAQDPKRATPVSGAKTSVPEQPKPQEDKKSLEYLREKGSLAELDEAAGANQGIAAAVR